MIVAATVLASAQFIKVLETAQTNFDLLQTVAKQGLPVGMNFILLSMLCDNKEVEAFFTSTKVLPNQGK